jgi:hypothetical protein
MSRSQIVRIDREETPDAAASAEPAATPRVAAFLRLRVVLLALLAALISSVGLAGSASAASQTQAGNCNSNYAAHPDAYSLVARSPKIWSNNGTSQAVRYRSLLDKWNGSAWAGKATGQWRQGTATPNTAWQGAAGTWELNPYGPGHYSVRVQVQYLSGGVWGGTTTSRVGTYYLNTNYGYGWALAGTVGHCMSY